MKERPIIFSTESVRAILNGRKTQTRRAMNPQPSGLIFYDQTINWRSDGVWSRQDGGDNHFYLERLDDAMTPTEKYHAVGRCPFGIPDDRLWVREQYQHWKSGINMETTEVLYKADYNGINDPCYWENAPFMPRKFSRITLEITDVRCERIKSISEDDRFAEGYDSIGEYIDEWNRSNAKRGYDWESNPWVWVIEFKRVNGGAA